MRTILAAVGTTVAVIALAAVPAFGAGLGSARTKDAAIETAVLRAGAPAGQSNARHRINARDRTPFGAEDDAQGFLRCDILDRKGRKTGKVPASIHVIATDLDNGRVWESASAILPIDESFSREALIGPCFARGRPVRCSVDG